ncbi:single-stranded-DNA-specific exonuclease RecJ, partial [Myxococcota bacterium]|nr:single-stranded-DNA-specific exonuclease RecJ [Myxococcota bacterium]
MPRGDRPWVISPIPKPDIHALSQALSIPSVVAQILLRRGFRDVDEIRCYLSGDLCDPIAPMALCDMPTATTRILRAVAERERVLIYGDYDVDGLTSAALLWLVLHDHLGVEAGYHIPTRIGDGYGLSVAQIDAFIEGGVGLLITVDSGAAAYEEVAYARARGLDVIIIDHHPPSDPPPPALAHLNPLRGCGAAAHGSLAAVGVTYMLALALAEVAPLPSFDPHAYVDLVALGTVADVMPLTGLNRRWVRQGVERMRKQPRAGLAALMNVCRISAVALSARDLGFRVSPRLNAPGRLGDATPALRLLICEDRAVSWGLARQIEAENVRRRAIERHTTREAIERVEAGEAEAGRVLLLAGDHWHLGVMGIVAARLVERYHRPAILLARVGDQYRGSARSPHDVNIKATLSACDALLERWGGHEMAVGLALPIARLAALREALGAAPLEAPDEGALAFHIDAEIEPRRFSRFDAQIIERLGPF